LEKLEYQEGLGVLIRDDKGEVLKVLGD